MSEFRYILDPKYNLGGIVKMIRDNIMPYIPPQQRNIYLDALNYDYSYLDKLTEQITQSEYFEVLKDAIEQYDGKIKYKSYLILKKEE